MKSITNAIIHNSGEISVNVFKVSTQPIESKKLIGFLQDNPLYMDMYVKEYLEFVTNIRNVPKSKN